MRKTINIVFTYFFPIFMIDYYLIMRGVNLNTVVMLPIFALLGIKAIEIANKNNSNQFLRYVSIFLLYSLLTVVLYIFNDAPVSCYTSNFRQFVFPILFAYLGCAYSKNNEFNKWYLIACAFCFVLGFYLYATAPSYYVNYLHEAQSNWWFAEERDYVNETNILEFSRFSSFFTSSYIICFFSIPALILSLAYSLDEKRPLGKPWCYAIAVVSFIAAIICLQRIAIAFSIVIVSFYGLFAGRISGGRNWSTTWLAYVVIIFAAVVVFGQIAHLDWFDRIAEHVGGRIEVLNFTQAMSDRMGQYESFDRATSFSYIFGLGLGSCGHAAGAAGLKAIYDGEFVKLFYEFGIVGCVLFALPILSTLRRGLKSFNDYHAEVFITLFYLAAGVGADSLTFFVYSAMFWFAMGRIWNKDYAIFKHFKSIQKT